MASLTGRAKQIISKEYGLLLLLLIIQIVLLVITVPEYGVTFDEPIYLTAAEEVRQWTALSLDKAFQAKEIEKHWGADRRDVHPSGMKWLYLLAQSTIFWQDDPFYQSRWLTILGLSLCLTLFFHWVFRRQILWTAISLALLYLLPRFFAHCHFAATDIPLVICLTLLTMCLHELFSTRHFWICALLLGFLACLKITGILLSIPLLCVVLAENRTSWKKACMKIFLLILIAGIVFLLLNPDWWFSPISRARQFIAFNAHWKETAPFTVFFNGVFYLYRGPFYFPLAILAITTPLLHLFLGTIGFFSAWRQRLFHVDSRWILIIVGLFSPILLLMLPTSPTNDMERYLIPGFPFAICFVVVGIQFCFKKISSSVKGSPLNRCGSICTGLLLTVLLCWNVGESISIHPFELSYFNPLIGGLPGAARRGFEVNYWWDVLNDKALGHINEHCYGCRVFFPISPTNLYFRHMIKLQKITFTPAESLQQADFILFYARPNIPFWEASVLPRLREFGKESQPVWILEKDGVPLLRLDACRRRDLFIAAPP